LAAASGVRKGGYVLSEPDGQPQVILIGTGSEVHISLEAAGILKEKGIAARVVSMPSWEIFDAQPVDYRNAVLPPGLKVRVSIEAASTLGWERYVGTEGTAIGVSRFGASAPGEIIYEKLGLTAQNVAKEAMRILKRR
jgi:transketolase